MGVSRGGIVGCGLHARGVVGDAMRLPGSLFDSVVRGFRRQLLASYLRAHGGNRSQAARALGLQRTYLLRLMLELGLRARSR